MKSPNNYFSEETLSYLKPQQGLSERYQRRVQDVTLVCKLTHAYGKYHLVMLHRELAMSEERTTCISPSMPMRCCGTSKGNARGGGDIKKKCVLYSNKKRTAKDKILP